MDSRLVQPYIHSTIGILKEMTGIDVMETRETVPETNDHPSLGVASVITFAGRIKGRFVIDFEPDLARAVIQNLSGEDEPSLKDRLMLGCIAELNNIIAGDANTTLNNQFQLGLRLAPPIVFSGKNAMLSAAKLESEMVSCQTAYGELKLNIAFQGGLSL